MTKLGERLNRYGFIVDREANKLEIKKAVQEMYGVNVKSVNTMVIPGKQKIRQTTTRISKGMKKPFKKAIVTLEQGETIDFYSNV
jgi:large subunit ribosomal protein L23